VAFRFIPSVVAVVSTVMLVSGTASGATDIPVTSGAGLGSTEMAETGAISSGKQLHPSRTVRRVRSQPEVDSSGRLVLKKGETRTLGRRGQLSSTPCDWNEALARFKFKRAKQILIDGRKRTVGRNTNLGYACVGERPVLSGTVDVQFEGPGTPAKPSVQVTNVDTGEEFVVRDSRTLPSGLYRATAADNKTSTGTWIPQVIPGRFEIGDSRPGVRLSVIFGTKLASGAVVSDVVPSEIPGGGFTVPQRELQVGSVLIAGGDGRDVFTGRVVSTDGVTAILEAIPFVEAIPFGRVVLDSSNESLGRTPRSLSAAGLVLDQSCRGGLKISYRGDYRSMLQGSELAWDVFNGITYAKLNLRLSTDPVRIPATGVNASCSATVTTPDLVLARFYGVPIMYAYAEGSVKGSLSMSTREKPGTYSLSSTVSFEFADNAWRGIYEPTDPANLPGTTWVGQIVVPQFEGGLYVTPSPQALRNNNVFSVDLSAGGRLSSGMYVQAPYEDQGGRNCRVGSWLDVGADLLARWRVSPGPFEVVEGEVSGRFLGEQLLRSKCPPFPTWTGGPYDLRVELTVGDCLLVRETVEGFRRRGNLSVAYNFSTATEDFQAVWGEVLDTWDTTDAPDFLDATSARAFCESRDLNIVEVDVREDRSSGDWLEIPILAVAPGDVVDWTLGYPNGIAPSGAVDSWPDNYLSSFKTRITVYP